jgi:hypothetical protein
MTTSSRQAWERLAVQRDIDLLTRVDDQALERSTFNGLQVWVKAQLEEHAARSCDVDAIVRIESPRSNGGRGVIKCGDRDERYYERSDGLRCRFDWVLIELESKLLAWDSYGFHIDCPSDSAPGPSFLRWEYRPTRKSGVTAVTEPLSHLHPGTQRYRVPSPVLSPRELISMFLSMPPREEWR